MQLIALGDAERGGGKGERGGGEIFGCYPSTIWTLQWTEYCGAWNNFELKKAIKSDGTLAARVIVI